MTASGKDFSGSGVAGALAKRTGAGLTLKKRHSAEALMAFVLACLVSVGWLGWQNMQDQNVSEQRETHSRIVIQQWGDLLSSLKDAETGQRGFIITGNPDYLAPYNESLGATFTVLTDMRRLAADNLGQQQLAAITLLVAAKLEDIKKNIALRETQGFTAASQSVMTQSGKNTMDQIRVLVGQAREQEQQILNERTAARKTDARKTVQSLLLTGALGSLALLLLFIFLRWELRGRHRAETAEDASELQYQTIFNSMDEGFCIIDLIYDARGQAVDCRFLESNPAFEKQTGIHHVAGKRLCEIVPQGAARSLAICAQVALTGKAVRFVFEHQAFDSQWFNAYAVRLGSQDPWQVGIVFNNITLHKRAVDALRYSEQRFRALFNRGPIAMYSCDTSGAIVQFNACAVKLWGREPTPDDVDERFCGASKVYRLDGALLAAAQNPMIAVLKGEIVQANEVEFVLERPDGSRITVMANIVPLKDGEGAITGAINCFYDNTERSRLERQTREQAEDLIEQHRQKDEFLAMLSHELRNPLAPLTSAVELLGRQQNQDPVYSQACRVIERQVRQMKHLIDDLLEVSRITSGTVQLRKESVRLGDIVDRALETALPLILTRRHQLTLSLPPHPLWLDADATRLEQVLVNLLNNAAKYTNEGGRLWLSVGQEGNAGSKYGSSVAVIKVRDTGIGIAAELLPHVFELFTQAERAIDRSQGGMGIGLRLVRQLVELHEGTVEAHSIVGQGSEFIVRLPLRQAAVPPLCVPLPLAKPDRPAGRRCRVLAVDDSVDAVESMAMLLRLSGHVVQTAYDGASVLQTALAMRPDVVLLDIGLPGLTGYEVAGQLRQEPRLKSAVLVALTGYGSESDRQRSKKAGFSYHLVKPAGVREVEKILAAVGEQLALQTAPDHAVAPEA